MMREPNGVTVIVCENLGRPSMLIQTTDAPMLLLDAGLTCEERMVIMNHFLNATA